MLPIAMHLLQKDGAFLNGHDLFLKRIGAAFHAYIEEIERGTRSKCMEDLTRYGFLSDGFRRWWLSDGFRR